MKKILIIFSIVFFALGCSQSNKKLTQANWEIGIIPSSIRIDPTTNENIENRFVVIKNELKNNNVLLKKNWVYDGEHAILYGARGEYVSFQLVLRNNTNVTLKGINIEMLPFQNEYNHFYIPPELFLEWSVQVKSPSTGYPKASLGKGWYPDALIPFKHIQMDSTNVRRRWTYPLELPDFNNRIDDQRSLIVWVDQYIPYNKSDAKPGVYSTTITVTIGDQIQKIPIDLTIWDFAIPNENKLKASLQHEGFLSRMNEKQELKIYQLFKRNRISLMDPTYKPDLKISSNNEVSLEWDSFDNRLKKYFTGKAFTSKYGYEYGPGFGEPMETFILPFNVYGKHGGAGWPNTGNSNVERQPENQSIYRDVIKKVYNHLQTMIDPKKTEVTVYLNGLDESYFPEAWDRMVFYGNIFKKEYPGAHFRIDGSYSEEAMNVVKHSINSWASHTINYNINTVKNYQEMGIEDWLYGPMLYESKVNSWVGSSTFIDLPLVNDRAISWSSWKYKTYSWISWGVGAGWKRAWYDPESWKDTYKHGSDSDKGFNFKKLNGNGMLLYSPGIVPNVDEACPSIRLKMMRNGVQEYEYLRLLSKLLGNSEHADKIVNSIIKQPFGEQSIGNLDVWSFNVEQWDKKRIELGEMIHMANKK